MRMWGPVAKSLHLFAKHFTAPPIDCTHGFAICSALVQVRHQTCLVKRRTSTVVFGWNCRGYMLTPYRIAFSCRHEKLSAYHSMNIYPICDSLLKRLVCRRCSEVWTEALSGIFFRAGGKVFPYSVNTAWIYLCFPMCGFQLWQDQYSQCLNQV